MSDCLPVFKRREMKVSIKKKKYEFSFDSTMQVMYGYEKLMPDHPFFSGSKITEWFVLFYSILIVSNEGFDVPFDEFCKCAEDPNLFKRMQEYYVKRVGEINRIAVEMNGDQPEDADDKKKD